MNTRMAKITFQLKTISFQGVHIAETVHSSSRGSLAVFQSLFICIGMLIVLGLGYCVSDWRTLAWICMVPGCIHFIMIFFMHDTPYWLVEKDMRMEARYVNFSVLESIQLFNSVKSRR